MAKPVLTLGPTVSNGHRDILHDGVIIGRAVKQPSGGYAGPAMWDIWYGGSVVDMFCGNAKQLRVWLSYGPSCFPVAQVQA